MRRVLGAALLVVTLLFAGCRLLPAAAAPSASEAPAASRTPSAAPASAPDAASSAGEPAAIANDAPAECGFPPGTALEFAGRSTTAELNVQEVVGDPMSDDPADIYISRDKFDQGDLHGRLVCTIYVDPPGFVEITVHPEDGGRFVPPTPYPSTSPPPGGISETEAAELARGHVAGSAEWELAVAEPGPIAKVLPHVLDDGHYPWAHDLSPDRWIWRVFLVRGDEGVDVVIDYLDGSVLGTAEYIVN